MLSTELAETTYGGVTVLTAARAGAYPYGNSLLVTGADTTLLVDPSLTLAHIASPPRPDLVFVSHAHQDHLAGLNRYDAPVHTHELEVESVRSLRVQLSRYGLPHERLTEHLRELRKEFHLAARPDAQPVKDGTVFDLGGRTATVIHLPGHTRGHSGLLVEPDGFLFIADIDLSSFGPYYGDITSSLPDFESSIDKCAQVDARWFGTFHHKGVIEGATEFRARLADYGAVVRARDQMLLEQLASPRTSGEVAQLRLLYPPTHNTMFFSAIEARTVMLHLRRLLDSGAAREIEPGVYQAA